MRLSGITAIALTVAASTQPVVPWLDQRPAKAPPAPALAPPCRAGNLRAHLFLQGATGSLAGGVDLLNIGVTPCSLVGHPTVVLTGTSTAQPHVQNIAAPRPLDALADPPGSLRALAPGKSATVGLYWSNWCGTQPDGIELRLASRTTLTVPVARAPRCDQPQSESRLSVAPFVPTPRRLPVSSRLPLRVAIVGARPARLKPGLRAFRVHRGSVLHYEVAVTNTARRTFRFSRTSCPVYLEALVPAAPQAYVLNCRSVGTIAHGETVRFAMQIPVPATMRLGVGSLTWELAPKTYEAPFAPAALWIVP